MEFDIRNTHPFIDLYLKYIENTEPTRLHHIWAALSGITACLGRRCAYPMGVGNLYPNLFVVLVGPPAVRKSTALKLMQKLLREMTNVRFAPDDTGGQRQGILAAMTDSSVSDENTKILEQAFQDTSGSLAGLAAMNNAVETLGSMEIDLRDPRSMYVCQPELKAFLGENNTQMTTFMCKMYDGDPYDYRLKSSSYLLSDALLGLLGCTTPSEIALALPQEAIGGGFTSRIIFVYADRVHRKIARPTIDHVSGGEIANIFSHCFHKLDGEFKETPEAAKHFDDVYMRGIELKDPRFVNYVDRRDVHLKKLAMAFAASRKTLTIEKFDVTAADQLLMITEERMADALGEYGMSPLGAAKQKLLEYINSSRAPIPKDFLYGIMSRDMKLMDFNNSVNELANTGKVKFINLPQVGQCLVAISQSGAKKARKGLDHIADLMRVD